VNSIPFTLICLIVTAFVIYGMVGFTKEIRVHLANLKKKRQWIKNAVSAQAVIVDRKEEYNSDAEWKEDEWDCQLAFRLQDITRDHPEAVLIWAAVSEKVYAKYRQQDKAQIYSSSDDPFVFIIDGE